VFFLQNLFTADQSAAANLRVTAIYTNRPFHEKADPRQEVFTSLRDFVFFRSAKPLVSPPFHPHSLVSDFRSVPVGCSRFIRCCYLA
jgi:hypothetical protein